MNQSLGLLKSTVIVLALGIAHGVQAEPMARLHQVEGQVLVNQGKQYVPAQAGTALQRGDRVLVLANSSAVLTYTDNCTLRLGANQLLAVDSLAQCRQAAVSGSTPGLVSASASTAQSATGFAAGAGDSVGGLPAEGWAAILATTAGVTAVIVNQTQDGGGGNDDGGGAVSPSRPAR